MKKSILFFLLIFFSCNLFLQAQVKISDEDFAALFNARLTDSEKTQLKNGEFVFNSISSIKNIRINKTRQTEKDIETVRKVNPNHLIEVIKILPYKGNEDLIELISVIMQDIDSYKEIPYYSERHGRSFQLFSEAEILSIKR